MQLVQLAAGTLPQAVDCGASGSLISNLGAGTLLYGDAPDDVTSSLLAAAEVTLYGTAYLTTASTTTVRITPLPAVAASGAVVLPTKRVTMPISAAPDIAAASSGLTDVMQRWALTLPVATTRWRLRIRNKDNAGTLNMTDVYQGVPSYTATGGWTSGNFTAAPTNVLSLTGFPTDGTEYTSAWVTNPAHQFEPDVLKGLSFGFTLASNVNVTIGIGYGGAIFYSGAGAAASAAAATAVGSSAFASSRLDVRLEVEFAGNNRVVLFIGDSTMAGAVDVGNGAGSQPAVVGPNALWPAIAGMRDRFMWVNASAQGKDYADFTAAGIYLSRLDLATTVPDEAVLACGINTLNVSPVATEITALLACIAACKTLGIKRIKVCTVIPQPRWKPGRLTAFAAIGATSIVSTMSYANGEAIDIGWGLNAETVTASGPSTGTKPPFTTPVGALTKDHGIGETTGLATESKRKLYNATLQLQPNGLQQVVDLAKAMSLDSGVNGEPNPDYYGPFSSTLVHPNMAGWTAMAEVFRIT